MLLSLEEGTHFEKENTYTDLVQEQFGEKLPGTAMPHRNAVNKH